MNILNASDDQVALAMLLYLRLGAGSQPPITSEDFKWRRTRAATKEEFARRFPRQMDCAKKGKRTQRGEDER